MSGRRAPADGDGGTDPGDDEPFWRRLTPEQPFADRDRLYYSPFCVLIGAGFLALSLQGFAA